MAGRPGKHGTDATDEKVFVSLVFSLSLKGEGTDRAQILRDIFFCLATEEQKIGPLRLNIAEKKHGRE
ncbi:hypothetical protein DL744_09955 [Shigella dysenteriae]|nr:hypothetical protein AWB62_19160 [Escherichia coli]EAA4812279.1 hypothetical protein [Shigella boydii]EFX9649155.1 hypothetical protein [Shigella dysenteriae]HCK39413.1 hypothetical protein [Shigella sp.]ARV35480.1 hypothetical protein BUQ71_13180 [Escherichia coli]